MIDSMERIANKARSFQEADEWDRKQYLSMTLIERYVLAEELKRRAYGDSVPDIRAERLASKRRLHEMVDGVRLQILTGMRKNESFTEKKQC